MLSESAASYTNGWQTLLVNTLLDVLAFPKIDERFHHRQAMYDILPQPLKLLPCSSLKFGPSVASQTKLHR